LSGELETKPSVPPAAFVAVRMETAPTQVWRHLRRRFAEHLLEAIPNGTTLLDHLLDRYISRLGRDNLSDALGRSEAPELTLEAIRVLEHFAAAGTGGCAKLG
jgi:hypothetical protein